MARIRFVSHAFLVLALVLLLMGGVVERVEAQNISPWTSEVFTPDGDIGEFIDFAGDSQEYFVTNVLDSEFGKIKAGTTLTPGVFVGLDSDPPVGAEGAAGPTGFQDRPGIDSFGRQLPTGFNVGKMFVGYNADLDPDGNPANGTGVYFMAMDISAPSSMDPVLPSTQPVAFDVDGDGDLTAQKELIDAFTINEAPLSTPDQYQFLIDTNPVFGGVAGYDVTITLGERGSLVIDGPPALEAGAIPFGPQRNVPNDPGTPDDDAFTQRFLVTSGIGAGTEAELLPFLDWNQNGMIDEGDFGIGDDVEIAIMNVSALVRNTEPACAGFRVTADTFDDVLLGGGAEDLIEIQVKFPAPDIEVKKLIRCLNPVQDWSTLSHARVGEEFEFEVTIENWGNLDLDVSIIEDTMWCIAPAEWDLVDGSCSPAGDFCDDFEEALDPDGSGSFPVDVGTLLADDGCAMNLGEEFVFTFKIWVGPEHDECVADPDALCDDLTDCFNSVSVRGETEVDPLPEDQEEDGNVDDEFDVWAEDLGGDEIDDTDSAVVDTSREATLTHDDNVAGLELECRNVTFDKTVSAKDTDGNPLLGLLPILGVDKYPITVTYDYVLKNDGEVRECVTFEERFLCDDIDALITAGENLAYGSCPICLGGAGGAAPPGGQVSTKCEIVFSDPAALQALLETDDGRLECADPDPLCYDNCATATVEACPLPEDPPVCDTPETCEDEAKICAGGECCVEVTKEVKCKDDPDTEYSTSQETMPDEDLTFRITIENCGPTDILHLCITDDLDCETWVIGSVPPFPLDGTRHCMDLTADPFKPGDTLVYTFDVHVPAAAMFSVPTPDVDCTNCVTVEGYTDEDADLEEDADCEDGPACAEIDVKVADIDCEKLVCADFDADGTCDTDFTNNLGFSESEVVYPLRLIYRFTAINPASRSEVGLENVTVTDEHFVADFLNAGMTVQPGCLLCKSNPCDPTEDNTTASLADLGVPPPNQTAGFDCWVEVPSKAVWDSAPDPPFGTCYNNTATVSADPKDIDTENCKNPVSSTCTAEVCISEPCTCTKANFDIWNQNEVKFSGTHRCICHWDQAFISEYEASNHMLRENLQTDKGKARIRGLRSTVVCGEGSRDAPLLGLAAKRMTFASGDAMMAGMPMVGAGVDPNRYGQILYNLEDADPPPPELAGAPAGTDRAVRVAQRPAPSNPLAAPADLPLSPATIGRKGSFLVYPKVELKWDAAGNLIQDTFISLANDYGLPAGESMIVQLYFVRTCNAWVDATIKLTQNEPTYWSAYTGNPKGVQPFTALSDGIEDDDDPRNPGGKRLRGYILAWAINNDGQEINWNHLTGSAMIINYLDANAWEYESWGFRAVDADSTNGEALREPFGQIDLDTVEYEAPPAMLLLDFYATGTMLWSHDEMSGQISPSFIFDTDLTLWPPIKDLRK